MKILHITNVYAPAGGIETYVIELLSLLESSGQENALIYRQEHPRTPPAEGKPIYHIPITKTPEYDRQRIAGIIQNKKPTVIYLHDVYDPILIKQVAQLAPTAGYIHIFYPVCPGLGKLYHRGDKACSRPYGLGCVPMIYLRRCASARHPGSVYRIMKTTHHYLDAYRSLPRVMVGSNYMKDLMIQNKIKASRVDILPPHFVTKKPVVSKLEVGCRDIMFAGRLEYEKGVPYLLEAFRQVPPPHQLLIAGDGSLKHEYMQLAKNMEIADRVQFLGWLSDNDLDAAYQRCVVTVMPTIMPEPFGKVGIEAMANGRPVIAFDVGGISDWLQDGYNGFLVPPRDVKQLANKLNVLLNDIDLATKLGANGKKYVQEHYTPTRHVNQLLQILETTVNSG